MIDVATGFEAILPKKYTDAASAQKQLDGLLRSFATIAQAKLQTYPPAQPWKNPPKTGLRAGGKRTGTLGRGWTNYTLVSLKSVTLQNNTSYGAWVQGPTTGSGPGQTQVMKRRGWPSVTEVGQEAMAEAIAKAKLTP